MVVWSSRFIYREGGSSQFRDDVSRAIVIFFVPTRRHAYRDCEIVPPQEVQYVGVSKNRGTPKWMVYDGNPYENG